MTDLLTLAKLLADVPPAGTGWKRVELADWLTGFDATVWNNGSETVVAILGLEGLLDVIGSFIRRLFGYDPRILEWVKKYNPDVVIGHSGGGGIASWIGSKIRVRTVTFASGRTRWSLENDGTNQTNVWITGDRWGDPEAGYGMPLKGTNIVLKPVPGYDLHQMPSIIAALEKSGVV